MPRYIYIFLYFIVSINAIAQQPKLIIPEGHSDDIRYTTFSPDGKYLLTYGGGDIKIWDVKLGALLHTFTSADEHVAFSPDGKLLVIPERYGSVNVYKTGSWALWAKCQENSGGALRFLNFCSDNKRVITASTLINYPVDSLGKRWIQIVEDTLIVKTWNVSDGRLLQSVKVFSARYLPFTISPDGTMIATTSKPWNESTKRFSNAEVHVSDLLTSKKLYNTGSYEMPSGISKKGVYYVLHESLEFSSDSKRLLVSDGSGMIMLLDAKTGTVLAELEYPQNNKLISSANFAGDPGIISATILFDSLDNQVVKTDIWKINEQEKAQVIKSFTGTPYVNYAVNKYLHKNEIFDLVSESKRSMLNSRTSPVENSHLSKDGKTLLFVSRDQRLRVINIENGKLLFSRGGGEERHFDSWFTDDDKTIISLCNNDLMVIDRFSGHIVYKLTGHKQYIRKNCLLIGKKVIITVSPDSTMRAWDRASGQLLSVMNYPQPEHEQKAYLDSNETKVLIHSGMGAVSIWDISKGKMISYTERYEWRDINAVGITHDWTRIITRFTPTIITIKSNATDTGKALNDTVKKRRNYQRVPVDLDNTPKTYDDTLMIVWDIATGEQLKRLGYGSKYFPGIFDQNESMLVSANNQRVFYMVGRQPEIRDIESGGLIKRLKGSYLENRDHKFLLTVGNNTLYEYDMNSGDLISEIETNSKFLYNVNYADNDQKITASTNDNIFKVWDRNSKKLLKEVTVNASPDGVSLVKNFFYATDNNKITLYDLATGKYLYTFLAIDSADYLVLDSNNRYDGTKAARDLLYFVCNDEVVELSQVKELLWVSKLAERIIAKETINAKTLSELDICGLTPEVKEIKGSENEYKFKILPRRGGIGETILYVNGVELKRFGKQQLKTAYGSYELVIKKADLKKFFVPGEANNISVKALTKDNSISSRSEVIDEDADSVNKTPPNLYAVVVGVSDYKDDHLDLRYAAKDAQDIANALETAAEKLLNTDGKQHVFIQRIHTSPGRDHFPEKKAIQQALSDIGKKSKPNDVLLVFFAGHGKLNEKTKQFHFLTAEATAGMDMLTLPGASISSEELFEWMKPHHINVKKRILIFDACHSGQLNKDVVKVGSDSQGYMTARGDEQAEKIKAIEKMNEKSGLFILSASGSDQKAYEISGLEQGVLTYSLLHAIKEQPEILNDQKYLDLSRWFNAAERTVSELMKKFKSSQQVQIVSTTNFEIGVVDDEVRRKIILPQEKFLFTSSEFRHTRLRYDTLQLRSLIDKELGQLAEGNNTVPVLFNTAYTGADVYSIVGDYIITGTSILVNIMVLKGGMPAGIQFNINGETSKMQELAAEITRQVLGRLQNSK